MDFDEWTWRKKISLKTVSDAIGICGVTLSQIKNRKVSPQLHTALMIYEYSDREITLEDLLPEEKKDRIKKVTPYNSDQQT